MNPTLRVLLARPLVALAIAGVVVGVMYLHAEPQRTPVTHREQRVGLSDAEQMALGAREYKRTLRDERARIVSTGRQFRQVQRVARRITAVASLDKAAFTWRVTLIRKHEANAYCLPGGKIVVYTGILPLTKTDAGLATVLGHEVSHATAEHGAERLQRQHMTGAAAAILAGGVAFTPWEYSKVMALLGAGGTAALLPFSRAQESEADHIGLVYMARGGYDPREAVRFWERMARAAKQQPPEFASDHPSDQHRIERIRSWLPQAEGEYRPSG